MLGDQIRKNKSPNERHICGIKPKGWLLDNVEIEEASGFRIGADFSLEKKR